MSDFTIVKSEPLPSFSVVKSEPLPSAGILSDVGDTVRQYWDKINPVKQAQAVTDLAKQIVTDPKSVASSYGDQTAQLGQASIDAFKRGDHLEGIRHGISWLANGIPGLGAAIDAAGNKSGSGDIKGAVADTAALLTQLLAGKYGPAVLDAATEPGVLSTPARVVTAAAKAGGKDLVMGGVKAATGAVLAKAGPLGEVGDVIAGVPIIKAGLKQMGKGARAGYQAGRVAFTGPNPEPAPAYTGPMPAAEPSAAPEVIPPSRQLNAGAILTEPPADTSGPIPTDPATGYPLQPGQVPAAAPAAAPPAAPAIPTALLDGIAQGFKYKNFDAIADPAARATVERLARIHLGMPDPAPVPAAAPAPVPQGQPSQPAAAAPAPQFAQQPVAVPAAAAPQPSTIPFANAGQPVRDFAAENRAPRVQQLADYLHSNREALPVEDIAKIPDNNPFWPTLAKALGIKGPSAETIKAVIEELRNRQAGTAIKPSAELVKKLEANPRALAAAEALRKAQVPNAAANY